MNASFIKFSHNIPLFIAFNLVGLTFYFLYKFSLTIMSVLKYKISLSKLREFKKLKIIIDLLIVNVVFTSLSFNGEFICCYHCIYYCRKEVNN
jgi:hypothetical protein